MSVDVFLKHLSVADVMDDLYNYINPHNGRHSPMISKETLDIVLANKDVRNLFFSPLLSLNYSANSSDNLLLLFLSKLCLF